MNRNRRRWLWGLSLAGLLVVTGLAPAAQPVPPTDRILVLISIDAFRWDYLEKYHPTHLAWLAAEGAHMKRLIPVFPTLTFPNHQSIVTGLRPEHHGIVNNTFYDPALKTNFLFSNVPDPNDHRWYKGESIWATAVKQGRRANCLFWPGCGAPMAGVHATEYKNYEEEPTPNDCVDKGLAWLDQPAEKRPSFVALYFHHVDAAGHHGGPNSPEVAAAITEVDTAIGRLLDGIRRLKLESKANLIILSDHGMAEISTNRLVNLGDYVNLRNIRVDSAGALGGLAPRDGNVDALYDAFKKKEDHFRVYRREGMPERYHFRDNDRIPPVLLVPDDGWYVNRRPVGEQTTRGFFKATHGFDPEFESMGALFIASGLAFRQHATIPSAENIHLYNLFCATLGLKPASNDGDDRFVKTILAQ